MWSIVICCVKVAEFVQSLVGIWLAHSLSHFSSIPPLEIEAQPTQIALHHNQKPLIQFCGYFFFSFLECSNIRSHPSMSTNDSFHVIAFLLCQQIMVYDNGQECGMESFRDC
jgi:hypothetical protein